MTAKLNSYLHFNGNAKEAMDFYKSVFGGEVYSDTFGMLTDKFGIEWMVNIGSVSPA